MSLSDNYPDIRSVWMNDYANAGVIDPRCVFTRNDSTPSNVHYWSDEDHVSSENLLLQSSDFDTSWTLTGINGTPTGGQTDPSGGTNGFTVVEASGGTNHRLHQIVTPTGDLALVVYAKQNTGTRYLCLTLYSNSPSTKNFESAVFDLAGGSAATLSGTSSSFTSVTTSQTASGNGYYKCVLKATGTIRNANISLHNSSTTSGLSTTNGLPSYSGDGSSSIVLAFASLSSVGGTDYRPTTTQIHREFAATLKPVSYSGQPRFEYEPTGDREAKGLLIESSSSNLFLRSDSIGSSAWVKFRSNRDGNVAVAPDGTLTADKLREDASANNSHGIYQDFTVSNSSAYTVSVFAKADGRSHFAIRFNDPLGSIFANDTAFFNLSTGATGTTDPDITSSIQNCGNGWFRCIATRTTLDSGTGRFYFYLADADNSLTYTGNKYSGILIWGVMGSQSPHVSSYVKTEASQQTRSADSLSFIDDSIFEGGEHSIYWEGSVNGSIVDPRFMELSDGTVNNRIQFFYNDGSKVMLRTSVDGVSSKAAIQVTEPITGSVKLMATLKTAEARVVSNGTTITSATSDSFYSPSGLRKLNVGTNYAQGAQLNGHVKRVAVFSEALTETEAQSLTS